MGDLPVVRFLIAQRESRRKAIWQHLTSKRL